MMEYPYRQEWRSKYVKISKIVEWTRDGKHLRTMEAVRGLRMPRTDGSGMITGTLAAEGLPRILPAKCQGKPGYTGLVLLSFRIREGVETLEQLRHMVNLWSQTLLSFVGSSGSSLKVLIPYQLTGGGLPTDESQVALFQQYAYKRAAEYALASTGIKPEEVMHDGTESFRLSSDPDVYYNPDAIPIEMVILMASSLSMPALQHSVANSARYGSLSNWGPFASSRQMKLYFVASISLRV